ncbi:hypothetical protein FH972_012420 [Carpinus fangiana]|uniref:Uncharacterized protein n=1 Tax=Carpinus fangiana TaxID=176857 RepID=A0A5N6R4K2_9ROSI|nr:hypothetical protein FH972_012420 [Carpinus fangiana]
MGSCGRGSFYSSFFLCQPVVLVPHKASSSSLVVVDLRICCQWPGRGERSRDLPDYINKWWGGDKLGDMESTFLDGAWMGLGAPAERGPRGGTILSDAVGLSAGSDQGVALSCPSEAAVPGGPTMGIVPSSCMKVAYWSGENQCLGWLGIGEVAAAGVLPEPARRPHVMACCSGQRYAVGCPTCSVAVV